MNLQKISKFSVFTLKFRIILSNLNYKRLPNYKSAICAFSTNPPTDSDKTSTDGSGDGDHFRISSTKHPLGIKKLPPNQSQPIYTAKELESVTKSHHRPTKMYDRTALFAVKCMRFGFDVVSRYKGPGGEMTKQAWLNRCIFLETVAGVPGMVGGMVRHLKSLRLMQKDGGWIHTLLEEAENERMHLLIFLTMKHPGLFFRLMVLLGQGVFFNAFFVTYLVSPRTCHRFVGYLEEEAVKTYTGLLQDLDESGHLKTWGAETAPDVAKRYYKIDYPATVYKMVQCVRADEANHRDVNHTFAELDQRKDQNPFLSKGDKYSEFKRFGK